jgi:hypothetical protein
MTVVPQQKNLFTKRWRSVRALEPSELQLQISLVQWCRWKLRPDVLMWHTPNGEERDKRVAAKLKAMGVLPGIADLTFMWREEFGDFQHRLRVLFLELKARGRKLNDAQLNFSMRAISCGALFQVADNIDDAMRIIEDYGLTKPKDYDGTDDFSRSIDECYRAIRERKAKGGKGWGGWE